METFLITWTTEIKAETPLAAVRAALALQRDPYRTENRFGIGYYKNNCWCDEEIELDLDNPLGRPPAVINDEEVCCGHCGGSDTLYLEDVGQYCRLTVEDGVLYGTGLELETDLDSADPRLWCCDCGKESELPAEIIWT